MRLRDRSSDVCSSVRLFLVGEPTSEHRLGDVVKIGRRGSVNVWITVPGIQGHVAYPHLADNPITPLVRLLNTLKARVLDEGSDWFDPSTRELTTLPFGNPSQNALPGEAPARRNIHFNTFHPAAPRSES